MTAAVLDPKLAGLAAQIEGAFAGGPAPSPNGGTSTAPGTRDAASVASSMLSAYHSAAVINPAKAYKSKGLAPTIQVSDPAEATSKDFWDSVWTVVQTVGPVVVDALSKDYQPNQPNLSTVIQGIPANRRNDKDWVDFATTLLLSVAQGTVQVLSGQKDFTDPASQPPLPQPPAGADKGFFDDAWGFVQQAAPVAMPIIMSLL